MKLELFLALFAFSFARAFVAHPVSVRCVTRPSRGVVMMSATDEEIVSPFAEGAGSSDDTLLELTTENVESVLDEMRPYLISDGGNVKLSEIDGPVVKLELEGACGSCPSSSMTMKMGLERRLKEKIPEISEVIQSIPDAPALTESEIEVVLDSVRPFLSVAGGSISVASVTGVDGLQPTIELEMKGKSKSLQSVRLEIMQRIQRHFMQPQLRVEWSQDSV